MGNEFFLDTAYAIALSVESDEHHQRAEELAEQLLANQTQLVTTRAVLLEIGNALSKKRYRQAAGETLTGKYSRNYNVAMKTRIVRIGNSQGIRIPKLLLERSNLAEEVELEAEDNRIIIRSTKQPRQDWESAFSAMAARGDDGLLDKNLLTQTRWDEDEWQW